MREIKFRIWDIKRRDWLSEQKCNESDIVTIGLDGSVRGQYYSDHSIYPKEDYTLQQFTGLKDKNGKEIYEGDIFKFSIENHEKLCVTQFGEYTTPWDEMSDKQMGFYLQQIHGEYNQAFPLGNGEGTTIIGNIFENPELLNGSK